MKKALLVFAAVLCSISSPSRLLAQDFPRVELFGGYSYLSLDSSKASQDLASAGVLGVPTRISMNGWEANAAFNVNRWFGVEGDFSGHYVGDCGGGSGLTCKHLSFMGGPRAAYRRGKITAFAHGLFGGDNGSLSIDGFSVSDTPFALAVGGGVDYAVSRNLSVRLGQVDYFMTEHFKADGLPHQDNIRVSAGIVFNFGGGGGPARNIQKPKQAGPCMSGSDAPSLGVNVCNLGDGLRVISVRIGSPAAAAGIQADDVIVSVDGRPVTSSRDIEAAVAASTAPTVKVSYRIKGNWLTDRDVKVR